MKDEPPETPANMPFKQPPKQGEMQEAEKFRTMADVLASRLEKLKTGIVMKNEPQEYVAPHRRIDSGQVWGTIFFVAVIGCGVWYLINNFRTQSRENHATETRQQQTDASIAALALKYNAITNWESSLPDRGGAQPFSIDLFSVLYGSNQQAVLIKCNVNDIFLSTDDTNNAKFIVSLSSIDTANSLSLELQCTPVQAKIFASTNQLSSFAVVFKCREVKREVQQLNGDDEGFSVKGQLLDAVQLP